MVKTFEVELEGNIEEKLEDMRKAASSNGVFFSGGDVRGSFDGKGIAGVYTILDKTLTVTITKKPWIVGMGYIKKKIKKFIKGE